MLATPERIPGDLNTPDKIIWHKPADRHRCKGDCDFHAIACSQGEDDGIHAPAPKQDVPVKLNRPHQSWCADCLDLV